MRLGRVLAAAAVIVALPRHVIAALHAAGFGAPDGAWYALIIASAAFWALLEALTVFHLWNAYSVSKRRYLTCLIGIVVLAVAVTNAPSLVADSAGLKLTQLLPVAGLWHWIWSISSIGANLLVVLAAGAADAAIDHAEERKRVAQLTDALDRVHNTPQPQVAPANQWLGDPGMTQPGVSLVATKPQRGATVAELVAQHPDITATEVASRLGISRQAVSKSPAWRNRKS